MLDKLANNLTEEATKAVVGRKINSIKFTMLLRDEKPGCYHVAFIMTLDDGTTIDTAWPTYIKGKELK